MKRFIVFILLLALLIASEYYLLTELFTQKRWLVIGLSLLVVVVCLFSVIRVFKRSFISS